MKHILTILILLLSACGPTVSLSPQLKDKEIKSIAVLPVSTKSVIKRERLDYLRDSLAKELQGNGFSITDDSVIDKVCSNNECPERNILTTKYGADVIAKLDIDSIDRTNFIAGFYNTITGSLTLQDKSGADLAKIDHTQREKGGLLFNSGQVIQGLKSTLNNFGDDQFSALGDEFAKTLVAKIPKPSKSQTPRLAKIESVDLSTQGSSLYKV